MLVFVLELLILLVGVVFGCFFDLFFLVIIELILQGVKLKQFFSRGDIVVRLFFLYVFFFCEVLENRLVFFVLYREYLLLMVFFFFSFFRFCWMICFFLIKDCRVFWNFLYSMLYFLVQNFWVVVDIVKLMLGIDMFRLQLWVKLYDFFFVGVENIRI